jgi:5-methylcytosine-specific restriction endonuclease McrA
MKLSRFASFSDFPPQKDADGKPVCKMCRSPLPPRRRCYCGEACRIDYLVRTGNGDSPRYYTWKRDHGVCALCGAKDDRYRGEWEADHIIPVVRGGGRCGLDGYRTLCVPCHRAETAALARSRAEERKRARVGLAPPVKGQKWGTPSLLEREA